VTFGRAADVFIIEGDIIDNKAMAFDAGRLGTMRMESGSCFILLAQGFAKELLALLSTLAYSARILFIGW